MTNVPKEYQRIIAMLQASEYAISIGGAVGTLLEMIMAMVLGLHVFIVDDPKINNGKGLYSDWVNLLKELGLAERFTLVNYEEGFHEKLGVFLRNPASQPRLTSIGGLLTSIIPQSRSHKIVKKEYILTYLETVDECKNFCREFNKRIPKIKATYKPGKSGKSYVKIPINEKALEILRLLSSKSKEAETSKSSEIVKLSKLSARCVLCFF